MHSQTDNLILTIVLLTLALIVVTLWALFAENRASVHRTERRALEQLNSKPKRRWHEEAGR